MLEVDRVPEKLATMVRDLNSGTSGSDRYKSVKNCFQQFFYFFEKFVLDVSYMLMLHPV